MDLPISKLLVLALICVSFSISRANSETLPVTNPLSLYPADAELPEREREKRLIFNIYRGDNTPKEQGYLVAQDDASPIGTRVTAQGPLASLAAVRQLTSGLFTPQTRETLRNLGRDFSQRARNLFQTSSAVLGSTLQRFSDGSRSLGGVGAGSSFGSPLGSSLRNSLGSSFGDVGGVGGAGDTSEASPATGFRLLTPETRERLRSLGSRLTQTAGTLFRSAQTTATRFASRFRPTTERAFISDFEADNDNTLTR